MKQILFVSSLLLLLFIFYTNDFGKTRNVEQLQISEAAYHELKANRMVSELDNRFQLTVDDYTLPFDEETDSFLFTVSDIENLEDYNPIFQIIMETQFDYEIALLDKTLTEEVIRQNEPVKFIVYSDDHYEEYDIYITTLPILTLNVDRPINEHHPIGEVNQTASMTLYDTTELIESDLFIRIRGGSSRAFPKNQYRVNLREFTIGGEEKTNHESLLGMRKDDDWIIYSPYNDPEKTRNILSNNLWHDIMAEENRFDINTGTKAKHVELFINNRYWGLYTLMHPIDAKQLDLNLERKAENSEIYYRSISNLGLHAHDFENSTGDEMILGRFELREPDEPFGDPLQWAPLHEHIMMHRNDLDTIIDYLHERTDIQNQINYYLFTLLLQATDNNYKNHNYISKFDSSTRIMLESPWDLDLTWGLLWEPTSPVLSSVKGNPELNHLPTASLIDSAIKRGDKQIAQMVKEKYRRLRADEWSKDAFIDRLADYEKDIYHSGAISRDKERWPNTAYNDDMTQLREYILRRLEAMDHFIENEL